MTDDQMEDQVDDQVEIAYDLHNKIVVTAMAVDIHNQMAYHMNIEQRKEGLDMGVLVVDTRIGPN